MIVIKEFCLLIMTAMENGKIDFFSVIIAAVGKTKKCFMKNGNIVIRELPF